MSEDGSGDDTHRYYQLVAVLDDNGEPGQYLTYRESIELTKIDTDRNFWGIYVHGDWVSTFDADDISSTGQLGKWLDRILAIYESAAEGGQEEVPQEQDFDELGGSAFQ